MKKYLQFNNPHYRETRLDVGAKQPQIQHIKDPSNIRGGVLDFSGRQGSHSAAMVTGEKWMEPECEQEAALDLSRTRLESQDEALDLSKPSSSRPERPNSQSYQPTHSVNQSHRLVHTPPASRQARSPAGQPYSLLQAALNSNQPNAGLHNMFDKITGSALAAMLEQRAMQQLHAGFSMADYGRGIKPFTTMSSRPLGITVPQMAHSSGAVVQGTRKPIAITAPQPHNSSVTTKSQNISNSTVSATDSNLSVSSSNNQGNLVSQSIYSTGNHSQISRQLNSVKMAGNNIQSSESLKDPVGGLVERYLIQPPDGLNRLVGSEQFVPSEPLTGFSCIQCSKTFKTKAALKLHTTVHKTAEERQYACTICSRRFLHRHHLVVHQRKHSGEKPFKCNACSKTFMAIFLLHKHLRKHARETGTVSQISLIQLKQLHDKKLISDSSQAVHGLKANPKPFDSESVIVLDDDDDDNDNNPVKVKKVDEDESGKLDRSRYERNKAGNILDIIENDPKLIIEKMKSDLQKQKALSKDKENKTFILNSELKSEVKEKDISINEIKPGEVKTEHSEDVDAVSGGKTIEKNTAELQRICSESKDTLSETKSEIKQDCYENCMQKLIPDNVVTTKNTGEIRDFPDYCSDDEVDLDPVTGEFIVLGRKKREPVLLLEKFTEKVKEERIDTSAKDFTKESNKTAIRCKEKTTENMENNQRDQEQIKKEDKTNLDTSLNEQKAVNKIPAASGRTTTAMEEEQVSTSVKNFALNAEKGMKANPESIENCLQEFQFKTKTVKEKESDNIFEAKTGHSVKSGVKVKVEDHEDKVDKEVAVILSIIKQKLCEKEDGPSKSKKPKLDDNKEKGVQPNIVQGEINTGLDFSSSNEIDKIARKKTTSVSGRRGKKKGKKVKCEICSRSFHSNHYLVLHMAVHKRNPMLQSLKKAKDYQMKAMGFINKINVTCEVCNKIFKFQKSLNSHMRVHSEKMIQTKLYRKAFRDFMAEAAPPSSRSVDRSQSQSNEGESQRCLSVIETLANKETAKQMKQLSFDGEELNISKDDTYDDDPPIRIMIGEDNIKRYLCHACDNSYTTKQKLRMHALIHKDNCFLCDICGKSFFRHITLEKHLSTHKLPRPHICDVCKKTFIHRSSLMRHRVVHDKSNLSGTKQNTSDISFEMKMLDTYTMLRQEQINKLSGQQLSDDQFRNRYNPLDLTVRVRGEDCLPPVLSPVINQSATQGNLWNLSPPLITQETSNRNSEKHSEIPPKNVDRDIKVTECEVAHSLEMMSRQRTESTCSESDLVAVEGHHIVKKRSRKTRVYQTSCRVCKEVFPNVVLLKSHMSIHNTVETHLYECHICRHRFTQSCSLLRHLKTSCQENRMKCVPCGRTFHRRNTFEQHMRLHQGGPTNLDESFFDKRPDETEIVEARESDIENNNLAKMEQDGISQDSSGASLQLDLLKTLGKNVAADKISLNNEGNESDSDARTYLYSEGEVHSRYNSDCSDTEWTPPPSPKKSCTPQDLTVRNSAAATMTLNLLSAVCSDIREAEKEQELKRKEMEEKQKELETIEILANLKRGVIQKTIDSSSTVADLLNISSGAMIPKGIPNVKSTSVNNKVKSQDKTSVKSQAVKVSHDKRNLATQNVKQALGHRNLATQTVKQAVVDRNLPSISCASSLHDSDRVSSTFQNQKLPVSLSAVTSAHQIPSIIDSNVTKSEPQIPVTVLEVTEDSVAEKKEHMEKARHGKYSGTSVTGANASQTPNLHNEMSQMKMHYPAIQERLSLLMKAQHTAPNLGRPSSPPVASQKQLNQLDVFPHTLPDFHFRQPVSSASNLVKSFPIVQEDVPQDLSVKRLSQEWKAQPVEQRSRSISSELSRPLPLDNFRAHEGTRYITADMQRAFEKSAELHRSMSLEWLKFENQKALSSETSKSGLMSRSDSTKSLPLEMTRSRSGSSGSLSLQLSSPNPMEQKRPESTGSSWSGKSERSDVCKASPGDITKLHSEVQCRPENLETSSHRIRTVSCDPKKLAFSTPAPQLVGMYQCELCSRSLYNKTDLHLHLMEHGRTAGRSAVFEMLRNSYAPPPSQLAPDTPLDFTARSTGIIEKSHRTPETAPTQILSKPLLPLSLDLHAKKFENGSNTLYQSVSRHFDISPGSQSEPTVTSAMSPVTSGDYSDSQSSPSTPSGSVSSASTVDALRQKIFSRRRSQGLDDLKVEFKTPEPTEMTETEKLKLLYRRECNRQAAQRSRMRKKDLVDSLLEKLSEMPNVKKEPNGDP